MSAPKLWAVVLVLVAVMVAPAQQPGQKTQPDAIPDAPSATQKPQQLPPPSPAPPMRQPAPEQKAPNPTSEPPATESVPRSQDSSSTEPPATPTPTPPPASPRVVQAQPGRTPAPGENGREDFTLRSEVNFVVVPVTVKDENGRVVDGLLRKDFAIYEDGVPQKIQLFTSDPFPLAAAVVIDTGMNDAALQKVQETLPALAGAFSQFDEVGVYIFGNSVQRISDFTSAEDKIAAALRKVRMASETDRRTGNQGGVPFAGGPFNTQGPVINGKQVDPTAPTVPVVRQESHVLNDAVLAAAQDLAKRERSRRRMLFVISDGLERGSRASYSDVLKVLLSNEIGVYALAVGNSALPGYRQLQKIHIPGQAYGDILPKYASATGTGDILVEMSQQGIESAYAHATEQARNEYTIGYTTRATAAGNYRSIEVRVHRPGLRVFAKDGYYPLPPQRAAPAAAPPVSQ